MVAFTMSLKPALQVRLEKLSKEFGFAKNVICENAISQYLDELEEDKADAAIAEQISQEIKAGKMKTFSAEEVFRELDI